MVLLVFLILSLQILEGSGQRIDEPALANITAPAGPEGQAPEAASPAANPQYNPQYMKQILPTEITGKIRSGDRIDYDRVYISGDIVLGGINQPIAQPVSIKNSTINGSITIEGVTFGGPVDFSGTTIAGPASFSGSTFLGDSNFLGVQFLRNASFRFSRFSGITPFVEARFQGVSDFGYAQFSKLVSFQDATFWDYTSFGNAQFQGDTSFEGVHFLKPADFSFSRFSQLISFWMAVFSDETSFANAQIDGTGNFLDTQYKGNVTFMGSRFGSDVAFTRARFHRISVFGLASFSGFSDFSGAEFGDDAIFAVTKFSDNARFVGATFNGDLIFESARIYSIQMDGAVYSQNSTISLKDADFTRMIARWDSIKDHLLFDNAAYPALVKNYRNLEWRSDANNCYYQYRRISQAQESMGWSKIVDIIAWLSCGYGVRVSYTIFWTIFIIIVFGFIFWAGNGMRKFELEGLELPGNPYKSAVIKQISLSDALYFSVAMFTTSQAPVNTYPVGLYRHLAMIEGILGWFLLGLFVVVLSGVLIR